MRGAEIAMIFQDPMTSLNPVVKIRDQIAEQIQEHEGVPDQQATERCVELLERVGSRGPASAWTTIRSSSRGACASE